MNAKHTATPWTMRLATGSSDLHIIGAGGELVAKLPYRDGRPNKPNADAIVRVVNSHDDLVAALRDLLEWCGNNVPYFGDFQDVTDRSMYERVTAALSKAEEA